MRDIGVIESDEYREEEAALMDDMIIRTMAAEVPDDFLDTANEWSFTLRAGETYRERGGTKARSIGGPARAVRKLVAARVAAKESLK
jgi:hypothetical protein